MELYYPLIVLLLGTLCVVACIVFLRLHAFIALILSAIFVGIISKASPDVANHWVASVNSTMTEFGTTAGKISFVIAIAALLGIALTESGAASSIVNQLLRIFGEKRAGIALLIAGFILSIPVFFDTVFFLLVPLAVALALKMGRNFVLYIVAMSAGAVLTHSLVAPTPGPLVMAETLEINLAMTIIAGVLAAIIPAIAGYRFAKRINEKMPLYPPSLSDEPTATANLPSFGMSILPILLPLILIVIGSVSNVLNSGETGIGITAIEFSGNKNIAMFLGLIVACWLWAKQKGLNLKQLSEAMEKPLGIAGLIILITSAGGAFGAMIRHAGIGEMFQALSANGFNINLIIVAWLIAALLKFAQGSTTVAVITTAGIMMAIMNSGVELPYHPIYIYLAIGFGGLAFSWMNDSGFWIVGKLSGMTEKETLRTWTMMMFILSVTGFVEVLLFSFIIPLN